MQHTPLLAHVIHNLLDVPDRIIDLIIVGLATNLDLLRAEGLDILTIFWTCAPWKVSSDDLSASGIALASILQTSNRCRHPLPLLSSLLVACRGAEEQFQFCIRTLGLPSWVSHAVSQPHLQVPVALDPSIPEFGCAYSLRLLVHGVGEELLKDNDSVLIQVEELEEFSGSVHVSNRLPVNAQPPYTVTKILAADVSTAVQIHLLEGILRTTCAVNEISSDDLPVEIVICRDLFITQWRWSMEADAAHVHASLCAHCRLLLLDRDLLRGT
mmetsp:Transcript_68953/g.121926  ORF Transcript_68953/g.121926 Transcript_68953/m.121926 type:complete len:270 (-) Transcript_68953:815-1624(-)